MNTEDLDESIFYNALQTQYSDFYSIAQKECNILCIPLNRSMHGIQIDYGFIESHILKSSSYFKSHYHTIRSDKIIEIDDDGYIITHEGYPEQQKIKIRSEEVAYNKDFRAYKLLWIDQPLVCTRLITRSGQSTLDDLFTPPIQTLQESESFLNLLAVNMKACIKILDELWDDINAFKSCYILLPQYLQDAANRLRLIVEKTTNNLFRFKSISTMGAAVYRNLCQSVENVVLGKVHAKVFTTISTLLREQDKSLMEKFNSLRCFTATDLGCKPHIQCSMVSAIVELCALNMYTTPVEKLLCLKRTVDEVINSVHSHMVSVAADSEGLDECSSQFISSDDLLLLLVPVVCQARPAHPLANLHYMEHFRWSAASNKDELGYILVSFKAVIEYIQSMDIDQDIKKDGSVTETAATSTANVRGRSRCNEGELRRVCGNFQRAVGDVSVTQIRDQYYTEGTSGTGKLAEVLRGMTPVPFQLRQRPPDVVPVNDDRQIQLSELIQAIEGSVIRSSHQPPHK